MSKGLFAMSAAESRPSEHAVKEPPEGAGGPVSGTETRLNGYCGLDQK